MEHHLHLVITYDAPDFNHHGGAGSKTRKPRKPQRPPKSQKPQNQTEKQNTHIWGFPKIGVPPNHPYLIKKSIINHHFLGYLILGNLYLSIQSIHVYCVLHLGIHPAQHINPSRPKC